MSEALAQGIGATRLFGRVAAVDDVDLHIPRGVAFGYLGPNGAGKTTLIRMLLGLLRPSGGEVRLFGRLPSIDTRRRLGYVPQGLGLYDDLTPAENMSFADAAFGIEKDGGHGGGHGRRGGDSGGGRDGDAGALPPGLGPMSKIATGRLPLGVQRRVAFAQALAHGPDLLVLDEPTSGVDPLARARLWEIISDTAAAGVGVLVTTHHMDEAAECDRLVVMAEGRVVAEGQVAEIVGDAQVTVVETADWTAAFDAVERAGAAAALVGRTVRVPGASPSDVRRMLGDLEAKVNAAPATLEERFLQLTLSASS